MIPTKLTHHYENKNKNVQVFEYDEFVQIELLSLIYKPNEYY